MGVHVILELNPSGVAQAEWAAVYDETLALLEAWKPRLLGWGTRDVEGARVALYRRSIRNAKGDGEGAGWTVVGDSESLLTAESQSMPRKLPAGGQRRTSAAAEDADVVVMAAREDDKQHPVEVFGDKTQGYPFHFAMLAAAMLVEERLPGHALAGRDIDRGQAKEAARLAKRILGRTLPLPVRVDARKLLKRLRPAYPGDALPAAFQRVFLGGGAEEMQEALLDAFPGEDGARHWVRELSHFKSANQLGAERLVISWLNAGRSVREMCRLACLSPEGPRFPPGELIDALASTYVAIPREARKSLDIFTRPEGESHSVASLFGGFLLDMEAMGRNLKVQLDEKTLATELTAAFGSEAADLNRRLHEKSARIEAGLRERADGLKAFAERTREAAADDIESLATIHDVDTLGPRQREAVQTLAWSVRNATAQLEKESARVMEILTSAKEGKRVLALTLRDRGPILTEDAWDEMLAVKQADETTWLLGLAMLDCRTLHLSQIQRALFENKALRRYAMVASQDEQLMREISEKIAKARSTK